jgi:hypothetical protein
MIHFSLNHRIERQIFPSRADRGADTEMDRHFTPVSPHRDPIASSIRMGRRRAFLYTIDPLDLTGNDR